MFEIQDTKRWFYFYNTHFVKSAEVILEHVRKLPRDVPFIMHGSPLSGALGVKELSAASAETRPPADNARASSRSRIAACSKRSRKFAQFLNFVLQRRTIEGNVGLP